ncbi:MAG: hypothetical protein IK104_01245 [Clostridia bacterium]|nr:hypothetical protein [Clostridia bacterium]
MFILSSTKQAIYNSDRIDRITLSKKDDAVLVMAGNETGTATTLGRYSTVAEAQAALLSLFTALGEHELFFEMPERRTPADDRVIHDGRVKRKGGS